MAWRSRSSLPAPFVFDYRGLLVEFAPADLDVAVDFNLNIFIDGEQVVLNREESMQFMREYIRWLDENR